MKSDLFFDYHSEYGVDIAFIWDIPKLSIRYIGEIIAKKVILTPPPILAPLKKPLEIWIWTVLLKRKKGVKITFFAKIFVNSKFQMVSHVEANDDMFSLFVRFFFIFGSFEQYWLKWNGHSHLQIVKRSLVGSKREAELPVPIFANKFFEKQHSPLWWV